ncbi:nuclear hormone receptor FTZ-F1 beta [Agrilus planipennis]|uniref:Nuclear hormone receptor FTZ-F1 beta n=1 Tax=Agrilus planipennis TaxID=224129 RepID=A0A1W4WWF8_AGRPL|nr:nuclear hormone receptor FTZ-F1 beta [Agrilus planipennis]XP_018328204.1 nuclear hormone receptor FTZ-F1 beta [Agrilus planipennis]
MAAEMRSPNVSVTPIKVEQYSPPATPTVFSNGTPPATHQQRLTTHLSLNESPHHGSRPSSVANTLAVLPNGDILDSSSDAEVAQIDFLQSTMVNMRQKKKKRDEIPRPMSWEGELSDGDNEMCIDEDSISQLPENLSVSRPKEEDTCSPVRLKPQKQLQSTTVSATPAPNYSLHSTPNNSPLLGQRHPTSVPLLTSHHKELMQKALNVPPTPSPDSAVHSAYSVFSSPSQSPLTQRHLTPNLSRNNSDASHSSCCSYSSVSVSVSPTQQFSPTHSPIQGRHVPNAVHNSPLHHNVLYRSVQDDSSVQYSTHPDHEVLEETDDKTGLTHASLPPQSGISRQQLINSPCPICGDKISGFHYGIFSCESCKGFFKRTVQNRKNYVCLRGASCPVTVTTRKKCPACRFDKCLQCGMKLEAIREDRTRGGRSTYQCSYSLPPSLIGHTELRTSSTTDLRQGYSDLAPQVFRVKLEPSEQGSGSQYPKRSTPPVSARLSVPPLLQEIMDVEHLWHYSDVELSKINECTFGGDAVGTTTTATSTASGTPVPNISSHPLLAGTALAGSADTNPDFVANLCSIADHRLYKIVKWCKSLPLFKNISIDDQICLLINSWCELLLFSCCFRSISTPGEIRISVGKNITLEKAKEMGLGACIERMLNFTDHLRRLRVDKYEYVAMKVIVLLTSDTSELREAEKVRASQEKALQALQHYTLAHYPDTPAKFGELLLRIPELQRTCQVGKEMLTIKSKDGEGPNFNLLLELLRGDH